MTFKIVTIIHGLIKTAVIFSVPLNAGSVA